MENIPAEVAIALIAGLYAVMILLGNKMEKIWQAISNIKKDYVEHEVCKERREQCACWREIENIKERLKK